MVESWTERLQFYTGSLYFTRRCDYAIEDWRSGFLLPCSLVGSERVSEYIPRGFSKHDGNLFVNYVQQAAEFFKSFSDDDRCFLLRHGDVTHNLRYKAFSKTRPAGSLGEGVLLKLNHHRHWSASQFDEVRCSDIPFSEKESKVLWRGMASGDWLDLDRPYAADQQQTRLQLMLRWGGRTETWLDVGVTRLSKMIAANHEDYVSTVFVRPMMKAKLSIEQQLGSKFLLMPEGKDVATGLKWALTSNSVVMMPVPSMSSWLMEERLVPWKHYVPVRRDFSDLEEKFKQCVSDPRRCREIIANAQDHMEQFFDGVSEAALHDAIIEMYLDRTSFQVSRGSLRRRFSALNLSWTD